MHPTPTQPVAPEAITLRTDDHYPITALRYRAAGRDKGHLIVAGATGVPQGFYRQFAEFAASQGYTTLTLDYRGIGLSKPPSLKGFRMQYLDWARYDLRAAVDYMASDTVPLFMVGHSFGGHAFGLLPNHARVARFYTFATGAGWHGWMPRAEQLRVLLMWRIVGPIITHFKGYLAWRTLGMGEDLPLGVYQDWKHWCRFPNYFFDDPSMAQVQGQFDSVTTPIVAANATDDLWATPASRDAFMAGYRNAKWRAVTIDPADGHGPIGHMGYFRSHAKPLWESALQWFAEHSATPPLPSQ